MLFGRTFGHIIVWGSIAVWISLSLILIALLATSNDAWSQHPNFITQIFVVLTKMGAAKKIFFAVLIFPAIFSWYAYNFGRAILASLSSPTALPDAGTFTLYLRSFDSDDSAPTLGWYLLNKSWDPRELTISRMLRGTAPLVAVGRPGEIIPKLGGYRIYFPDKLWKDGVKKLAHSARYVFLRA